jgi:hypothetical protein
MGSATARKETEQITPFENSTLSFTIFAEDKVENLP